MSETRDQFEEQLDCYSGEMLDIDDDIIDISAINFDNHDSWLQPSHRNPAEYSVHDLRAWLRADVEQDCNNSHDNRRSIDTRTFTRPKRRSGRLSFESIIEVTTPPSPNVWKPQSSPRTGLQTNDEDVEPLRQRRESTPPMLRPSNPGVSGLCSADTTLTSGQESLEAFLNMSQSKGIDSFINLVEPEFSDGLMNISQPSILYSSMMSTTRDDLSQTINQSQTMNQSQIFNQTSIEDSQILTESMMQSSMFGDVADVNFNDTFANITVLENTSFSSSDDRKFVAASVTHSNKLLNGTFSTAAFAADATYTPTKFNATVTNDELPNDPHASYIVNHKCQTPDTKINANDASFVVRKDTVNDTSFIVRKDTINDTSFIVRKDTVNDASFIVRKDTLSDASFVVRKDTSFVMNTETTDASFVIRTDRVEDATFQLENPQPGDQNDTFNVQNFDATFKRTPSSSPRKLSTDTTLKAPRASSDKLSMKLNAPKAIDQHDFNEAQNFDATFERTPASSPRKLSTDTTFRAPRASSDKLSMKLNVPKAIDDFNDVQNFDATFEKTLTSPLKASINSTITAPTSVADDHAVNSTFKAPNQAKMDATYENNTGNYCNDVPLTNRYNTYRKGSAPERARNENYATNNLTTKLSNETVNIGASLENLDSTFNKPAQKIPRKLNAPRALSRLPQSLQKSNPNLISNSLKAVNTVGRSAIPSFGFRKLVPPTTRNVESSLTSKLYGLGKMKSGSEQRLEVTRNAADFQITGTGGSTESIDSTQSAHSAPDFDDRLSVCSDSSHTSYSMRTMNIEDLQKATRMRDDYLKPGSTPKPTRRVLENTWVGAAKDLPSPILKNGPENYGSRGSSPRSTDSTVKTSSPLLSPAGSLQNLTINMTETMKDNANETKLLEPRNEHVVAKRISEAAVKPARSAGENRTGLRPPASWSSANQRPASGIPRPASRIPAPRSVRPATKLNQGGIKKGFL